MKLKKLAAFIAALVLVVSQTPMTAGYKALAAVDVSESFSYETDETKWTYKVYNDHAELLTAAAASGAIVVPDTAFGVPVTVIGENAFKEFKSAPFSVELPDTIKKIEGGAFEECDMLTEITMGDSVEEIGKHIFTECRRLKKVTLSNNIKNIPVDAFYGCTSLEEIELPSELEVIGNEAFYLCPALKKITIPDSVKELGKAVFGYCTTLSEITLSANLEAIKADAFYGCMSLKSLTIPEGVTSIGNYAFKGCTQLSDIDVPESVKEFGAEVFVGTPYFSKNVKDQLLIVNNIIAGVGTVSGELVIPDGVKGISMFAFTNQKQLTSVTMPDSVEYIGPCAFMGCEALSEAILSKGLKELPRSIFYNCKSLKKIDIPDGVTSIEISAFDGCLLLADISVPESVEHIGNNAFKDTDWLTGQKSDLIINDIYVCPVTSGNVFEIPNGVKKIAEFALYGKDISVLKLPSTLEIIEEGAFADAYLPASVEIPEGVTEIGVDAFSGASDMKNVTIPASVKKIGEGAFASCGDLQVIRIESKDCEIYDDPSTFSDYEDMQKGEYFFTGTIEGYRGSTAEAYANRYGYKFEAISTIPELDSVLPTTTEEWRGFVSRNGYVSEFGSYIVCCGQSSGSTGYTFKSEVTGDAVRIDQIKIGNPAPVGASGGGTMYIDIYKAENPGNVEARSYEISPSGYKGTVGAKTYYVDEELNVIDIKKSTTEIDDILPKKFSDIKGFVSEYGNVSVHGKYLVCCANVLDYAVTEDRDSKFVMSYVGSADIVQVKRYSITDDGPEDGSGNIVIVFEAKGAGSIEVNADFVVEEDGYERLQSLVDRKLVVNDDLTITDTNAPSAEGLLYRVENCEAILIKAHESLSGAVDIPEEILGAEIKKIPEGLFKYYDLSSVTVPKTVKVIEKSAFEMCQSLSEITIMNPDCKISDDCSTISNSISAPESDYAFTFTGVIKSTDKGAVKSYAERYGYKFENINDEPMTYMIGDANCDKEVNLADAVFIMQSLANPSKYQLSEEGVVNADVNGGGVTNLDALDIQKYTLGIISSLGISAPNND